MPYAERPADALKQLRDSVLKYVDPLKPSGEILTKAILSGNEAIARGFLEAGGKIAAAAINAWEVAILEKRGRLKLTMNVRYWVARSEAMPFLHIVPVNAQIAVESVALPGEFHDDPADRIIVATARSLNASLVTKDDKILKYPHVRALW